jgi:hypothetical protein
LKGHKKHKNTEDWVEKVEDMMWKHMVAVWVVLVIVF